MIISRTRLSAAIGATSDSLGSEPAFIENNRTYLPVRAIANALGVSNENIGWLAATNTATLLK